MRRGPFSDLMSAYRGPASGYCPDGVHILLGIGAPSGPRLQDAPSPKSSSRGILALTHNPGERLEKTLIFQ